MDMMVCIEFFYAAGSQAVNCLAIFCRPYGTLKAFISAI
ncbi:Uncharacterized protein dnl_46430 [Desulfonema limicola]|uniref:Uncharacterized protein n=1 Tax=Desulfonema limicola TaxID=45656 RepID=A0A975BBN0_9BACT|nr:Uncharacterized protein dnl_46430 [Desulfonema limicola]